MRALLACLILFVSLPVYSQGRWIKLAPFPEPAEEILGGIKAHTEAHDAYEADIR